MPGPGGMPGPQGCLFPEGDAWSRVGGCVPGLGGCWSQGMCLVQAGAPGPGGCLLLGGAWSWGGTWSQGVVPGAGGSVPGPGGCLVPGVPGPGGCLVRGRLVSQHALSQTPLSPGETATAADGTHPTAMHFNLMRF